ncbi:MAG: hypothetical protein ACE5Q4_02735 [Nitrosopumilus sp.]
MINLANLTWKAIHSDKTVVKPNYADINRETLKEFIVECDGVKFTFKKPKLSKFNLAYRLRTEGTPKIGGELQAQKRHVLLYDGKWYHILGEEGTVKKVKKLDSPIVFSEKLGESE